ncbi:hypothetical protein O9993_18225 [Vibrio lentus]|nr:hypothetical protein [Vibrio lentus]
MQAAFIIDEKKKQNPVIYQSSPVNEGMLPCVKANLVSNALALRLTPFIHQEWLNYNPAS